jgi:hypothetical protein
VSRTIAGRAARPQLADLLQAAFAAEFLHPGPRLTVHARWADDTPVLDNRLNAFRTAVPDLAYREVRLADVIGELLARGVAVDLALQDAGRSGRLLELLGAFVRRERPPGTLRVLHAAEPPGQGVLAAAFFLEGEVEWGPGGAAAGTAGVTFHTDPAEVAAAGARWEAYWEANGHAARIVG